MKINTLIFGFVLLFATSLTATTVPQTDVPQMVKRAFTKKFPNAQKVQWENVDDFEYGVTFTQAGKAITASFTTEGDWLSTMTTLEAEMLPMAIKNSIDNQLEDHTIQQVVKVEIMNEETTYQLQLMSNLDQSTVEAVLAMDGTLISQQVMTTGDNNDYGDEYNYENKSEPNYEEGSEEEGEGGGL